MGHRTLKRVPLDFQWALNKIWKGYVNPYPGPVECKHCGGSGLNPASKQVSDDFYDFAGTGRRWRNSITQDEVQVLVDNSRLYDFTHIWEQGKGWQRREDAYIPTADEVNAWSHGPHSHDFINECILVEARCKRLGVWGNCKICKGKGRKFPPGVSRHKYNAWREYEPPVGPGYQLWETVSEGSPITPVFATTEELADYCSVHDSLDRDVKTSRSAWLRMLNDEYGVDMGSMLIATTTGYVGSLANMPRDATHA